MSESADLIAEMSSTIDEAQQAIAESAESTAERFGTAADGMDSTSGDLGTSIEDMAARVDAATGSIGDAADEMAAQWETAGASMGDLNAVIDELTATFESMVATITTASDDIDASLASMSASFDAAGASADAMAAQVDAAAGASAGGAAAAGASADGAGAAFASFGGKAALALTAAAVASVYLGAKFQSSMTQLVTGAGESEANIGMVSDGIQKMAGEVGESTQQLSAGMYMIESAGDHGAEGLSVLQAAAQGAKVGNADLGTVADALTSSLNAYHLPATDAANVTSQLVATVAAGKMHMEDLASSLGKVLAPAAALHIPFAQVNAGIATMTAQGTDAATATTALRFLMASLAGPTKAAATEMEGLGVGESEIPGITASVSSELATLGLNTSAVANTLAHGGIQAALTQITDAIGKKFPAGSAEYEAALKAAVGGTRGMTAALELTGSSAATFTENIQKISGASADASGNVAGWSLVQQDFSQKLDEAKDSAEVLFEKVGTALIPTLEQLMGIIEKVINWLSQHKAVAEALAAVIAGVLVAAIGAWTVSLFAAGGALAFLLSPVTLIVAGIAALVVGIIYAYGHFKAFRDAIQDVVSFVTGTVVPFLKQAWDELSSDVAILVNDISSRWAEIQQIISFAIDFVRGYIELNVDTIEEIWSVFHATILRVLEAAWDQVELIFKTAFALIGEILDFFIDLFTGHWSAAWNDLLDILKTIWALIVGTIENTLSIVGNLLASLAGIVLRALGGLASGVVSVAEGIGKGIANGFIWGINAVISAWDWLVGMLKIPGFSVGPVHFGGLDLGASLQIGKVPYLQEGGVISGSPDGTLVVAGENNTDEVIGPLSDIADYAGGGAVASTSSTVVNVYATFPNAILPSNSAMQALVQMLSTQITQYLIASGVVVRQR